MKQFIVDRHTTPETPAMQEVPTMKMPVYETDADAEADLANLAEGQIIATLDTGDEMSQPVNAVEGGNLHAVTSNAVAQAFANVEDITDQITGKVGQLSVIRYGKVIQIIGYLAKGTAGSIVVAGNLPKPKYADLNIYGQSSLGVTTMYVNNQTAYVERSSSYNCLYNLTYIAE